MVRCILRIEVLNPVWTIGSIRAFDHPASHHFNRPDSLHATEVFRKLKFRMVKWLKRILLCTPLGRLLLVVPKTARAALSSGLVRRSGALLRWGIASPDIVARSYLTHLENQLELCSTISVVSGLPLGEILRYREEILEDRQIAEMYIRAVRGSSERWSFDERFMLGRRLAYYLLVRARKPRLVVEAGVDRGFNALLVCRALELNRSEGNPGRYIGIEIDPLKDVFLFDPALSGEGSIVFGDSVEIISKMSDPIDLFLHETTSEPNHVERQIEAVAGVSGDETIFASAFRLMDLIDYANRTGRRFLTHKDDPVDHWFDGSRIMFVFPGGR